MAAFAAGGMPPVLRGGRNNRTIYTVCAVIAGGLMLHRYYTSAPVEKDALPFPYGDHKEPKGRAAPKKQP
ncbi:uncharacterized protein BO95DRAFT_442317 [Aspergillus brunneoviolaceus CBS 621.78]|uniref:Uncharacterized protein n=1 Tax=Aspergillus brunneoviolaceus CBS 621.78 TaxID=1450534 RepID=A0ACD1GAD2_9EURO|nr:hypothetical protein BO95DRAFT_442317 [Aspergillus brunneoviolaceus CBS 621.78]RAH46190.1 hypothetical protein BO95DRAFT_442317 [Aspergillus brunneoviolaceus CBS 621.78]